MVGTPAFIFSGLLIPLRLLPQFGNRGRGNKRRGQDTGTADVGCRSGRRVGAGLAKG